MKRFEYKVLNGPGWNKDQDGLTEELNIQGLNGWALVAVVGEWFYFKREIISQIEIVPLPLPDPLGP